MSQELEIFRILADFVIFLISITIPTYAIAVSLLGPEYSKAIEKISKDKESVEKELTEAAKTSSLKLEDLEKKIKAFHEKQERMKSKFNPLSLYPSVIFPNTSFGLSLFVTLMGIYNFDVNYFPYYLGISLLFMGIGLVILGWALARIQKATREII